MPGCFFQAVNTYILLRMLHPPPQDNKTALDVAVEHEQWEVVELLVERGAISGEGKVDNSCNHCSLVHGRYYVSLYASILGQQRWWFRWSHSSLEQCT